MKIELILVIYIFHMDEEKDKKRRLTPVHIALFLILIAAASVLKILEFRYPKATLTAGNEEITVLVANTPKHQYRGLGRRDTLDPYEGMLFPFKEAGRLGIVMRDMEFPIDIIWLNNGVIVDIAPNVPLEPGVKEEDLRVYFPRGDANAVLEMSAGGALKNGLNIGDRVEVVDN
jgi:uncharacterized membrane protein (UPF0127 family)